MSKIIKVESQDNCPCRRTGHIGFMCIAKGASKNNGYCRWNNCPLPEETDEFMNILKEQPESTRSKK